MISRVAISYDLWQIHCDVSEGRREDALEQIELLTMNLEYLLHPYVDKKRKGEPQACFAGDFGRKNVKTLRPLCSDVASAIIKGDLTGAGSALDKAHVGVVVFLAFGKTFSRSELLHATGFLLGTPRMIQRGKNLRCSTPAFSSGCDRARTASLRLVSDA